MNGMMNLDLGRWGKHDDEGSKDSVYPTTQPSVSYRKEMMAACLQISSLEPHQKARRVGRTSRTTWSCLAIVASQFPGAEWALDMCGANE